MSEFVFILLTILLAEILVSVRLVKLDRRVKELETILNSKDD